jgi:glucose-1-phosphate thymidylyltransferase
MGGDIVGVVPAAGHATRLQPLACSKEVLPVDGRPVLEHLIHRMRAGGATRLRVVTRSEKRDVIELSAAIGAEVILAEPADVGQSIATGLQGLQSDDIALIGFPDTLWQPMDGFCALVEAVRAGGEVVLGLFQIRDSDLSRSDVVELGEGYRVVGVHVKPSQPPADMIWGCAAARVRALVGLEAAGSPGIHFDHLSRAGVDVRALHLSDEWIDIGTREALAEATEGSSGLRHVRAPDLADRRDAR